MPVATHATVTDASDAPSSADWSGTYSRFLAGSAAQAAATLGLYQQALLRVSEGKLEPAAFQNYLPVFAQTHGPAYVQRLSELGAEFLSRAVEIGAAFVRNGSHGSDPEFSDPLPVPPRFEPGNPVLWYEQFADYAGKVNNRALRAWRAQLEEVAAGEKTPAEVQQHSVDVLSRKAPELLQQLAQLYLDLLSGVNEFRARYEKEYFQGLLRLANEPEREPPVLLQLAAPRGETAVASLTVSNTTGARSTVRFSYTDARRLDGVGPAFSPELQIAPAVLDLDPDQEGKIRLSIFLKETLFDEGAPYTCSLYIVGSDVHRVEVQLRITATQTTHPAGSSDNGS